MNATVAYISDVCKRILLMLEFC